MSWLERWGMELTLTRLPVFLVGQMEDAESGAS